MKLVDYKVTEFMQLLASEAPAPGGGSAAALAGATGAALAAMVAALTLGKEKYREHEAQTIALQNNGKKMQARFLELIDADTAAFNDVSAAYKLPKQTVEEKAIRQEAIEAALKNATQTPFAMMETARECLQVVADAVGKTNASAASDLGVAAYSLRAAAEGAWLNVLINLGGIKDATFVVHYKDAGGRLLTEVDTLAATVSRQILASL
ncbi:MAG: cyclodeaminase/cyclohydrolase family protein [Veillonellaceae bacterium]|nr:cyclodeaminase/cyclohydrolase family protein [Veillonellaceae bacterium]